MRPYIVVALCILAGCATQPKTKPQTAWTPTQEQWEAVRATGTYLNKPDGSRIHLPRLLVENMLTVKAKVEDASGMRADLAVVENDSPNAFATIYKGRPLVAFTTGYLFYLGYDVDALATTWGHELAHLQLGHSGKARAEREQSAQTAGIVLGNIASFIVPFSGYLVSAGATAIARSFTRDEEREADALGLKWAVAAGFDPCGKARTVAHFASKKSQGLSLLSTHPSYAERSELADAYSRKTNNRPCQ